MPLSISLTTRFLNFTHHHTFPPPDSNQMAPTTTDKYSVIIPTYNERKNLPVITWLLERTFTQQ